MQNDTNINIKHGLRQARLRCGLDQKQVALLLDQRNANQISRYENGERIPSLATALKLEIIYHTPVRILLEPLFERFQNDINKRRKQSPHLFPREDWFLKPREILKQEELCFYSEILKDRKPTGLERQMINKHVVALINTMNKSDL